MLQMRITLCARFALVLAVLLLNTDAVHMPTEEDNNPEPAGAPAAACASSQPQSGTVHAGASFPQVRISERDRASKGPEQLP